MIRISVRIMVHRPYLLIPHYHYHNVFNHGSTPALMIRFFVDIDDLNLIEPAINCYSGDLIVG